MTNSVRFDRVDWKKNRGGIIQQLRYPMRTVLRRSARTWRESTVRAAAWPPDGSLSRRACPVAACCQERALEHCGQCEQMPCAKLTAYTADPVHGDIARGRAAGALPRLVRARAC